MRTTWRNRYSLQAVALLVAGAVLLVASAPVQDPLPSWNDGPAKQAILQFVRATTDSGSPRFVPEEQRIAAFDQDGTTWVEHPIPAQLFFALDRLKQLAEKDVRLRNQEPFRTVLSGDRAALHELKLDDFKKVVAVTHSGMREEEFTRIAQAWLATAKHPRFKRPFTELVYQPMLEVMTYLRQHGYRTYFVTGGGQDFVRAYAEPVYGIPPEKVVGSVAETKFAYDRNGQAVLLKDTRNVFVDDRAGKPVGIHMMIGRRPMITFGNSTGDKEMLEYTQAGSGSRLMFLVLHDDAVREYAYGPALGLPDTESGRFTQALYDEARNNGWIVISMKRDWKRLFAFEQAR